MLGNGYHLTTGGLGDSYDWNSNLSTSTWRNAEYYF